MKRRVVVEIVLLSFVTAVCCASFISPAVALPCPALPCQFACYVTASNCRSHMSQYYFPKESPFFLSLALIICVVSVVIIVCNRLVLKSGVAL